MADLSETLIEPVVRAVAEAGQYFAKLVSPLRRQARAATLSYLDRQRESAAKEVASFADIVRRAAETSNGADDSAVADCAVQLADRIAGFGEVLRDRPTSAILADTEACARRDPALFLIGAVAIGFVIGFVLTSPEDVRVEERTNLEGRQP